MKTKFLVVATALVAGFSFNIAQAEEEKGKGKGKGDGKSVDPAKRAEMLIKRLDKDGNGTLSKEEFAAGPMAERFDGDKEKITRLFNSLDKDGDGELSQEELSAPRGGKGGDRPGGKGKGKGDGKGKDKQ